MAVRRFVSLLLVVLLAAACAVPAAAEEDKLASGRRFTELFFGGAVDELWEVFDKPLRDVFGTVDGLRLFHTQIVSAFGAEPELVHDEITAMQGWLVYQALLKFGEAAPLLLIQWSYTEDGIIGGMFVSQVPREAPSEFLDYQTKTDLRLPFDGEWYVYWGGRTIFENHHAADQGQRFALDFLVLVEGSSHAGDGSANENYHAFGLPILAPGPGVVIAAVDGVPDNIPGVMNPDQPLGNYVVIDHQNGEYSFLAHLKQGSVAVQVGVRVEPGDLLGLCGNSGNSSEPHLHYHLQNAPGFPGGQGLPAQFQSYTADGVMVERGEPVRGQVVAP